MIRGDGWAVAPDPDALGEGYGFRKVRKELEVTEFGVNVITIPPGYESGRHMHERQQELYFVHRGSIEIGFRGRVETGPPRGRSARIDASTVRSIRNASETDDAQYLAIGAEGGYVGRDGMAPEGEENPRGTGL